MFWAMVELVTVAWPPEAFAIAPPLVVAVFEENVESTTESVPVASFAMRLRWRPCCR